jgi:hypothetical protein
MRLLTATSVQTPTAYAAANLPTTTNIVSSGGAVVTPNTYLNYLKIVPVFTNGSATPKFKVTGFTRTNSNPPTFIPQLLFEGSVTLLASNFTYLSATGLTATLSTGTAVVTVSSTAGLQVGQTLVKTAGAGVFGATPTILSIDSPTQFTANVNHATAGAITFNVRAFENFNVAQTITKSFGDGKIYNATGINDTAFVLVDTLGCELIEIEFVSGGATNRANAFIGAI